MLYFQGTDDKLWKLNIDGTGGVNLGGYKTRSSPVVAGDFIYFQGTDDKLWKVKLDGTGGVNLGGYKCASSPTVTADKIYFQGTDNKLWAVNLDGAGGVNLAGYQTKSSPVVIVPYIYFQGTDNKLWRIQLDGTAGINLGLFQTDSPPFVSRDHIYFQGTDDKLWKVGLDGTGGVNLAGYKTSSPPFVTRDHVYFRGTDDKLWRINVDGSGGVNLGGYKSHSTPVVDFGNNFIFFQGTDNSLWRINMDGTGGNHIGGFNTASMPFVTQPPNQTATGNLKYYVLALLYAPPGLNGGKSTSSVDYASTTVTGTTTTLSSSFKEAAAASLQVGPKDDGGGGGFSISQTTTDSQQLDIKTTMSNDLSVTGPAADGINHDEDFFVLWLNPTVTITVDPQNYVDWTVGVDGPTMITQRVSVSQLKNPALMSPGLKQQLAGFTAKDYATILAMNPFANGAAAIDPNRFLPTPQSFPYEPPLNAGDPSPLQKFNQSYQVTNTATHIVQNQYTVDLSVAGGINLGLFQATLSVSNEFQWTDTTTTVSTNGSTQSATVAVGGPSFGYTGPTDVLVYLDTLFDTFMFAFPPAGMPATVNGTLMGADGKPAANSAITLTSGGKVFHSFTDANGSYKFYGPGPGQVALAQTLSSGLGGHGIVINRGGGILAGELEKKPAHPA
jgi:Domain of unknown function (DUF5050)